jgi:spore germination protein YaaH
MEIGGAAGVEQAKKMKGAKKGYDDDMKTSFVKYKLGKESRVVWYETQKSMSAKLALADAEGLRGVSAWALGLELPETHRAFKNWK